MNILETRFNHITNMNKIRDLFKVKLYTIRSESKKKERERKVSERETLNKRKREKKGERKKERP